MGKLVPVPRTERAARWLDLSVFLGHSGPGGPVLGTLEVSQDGSGVALRGWQESEAGEWVGSHGRRDGGSAGFERRPTGKGSGLGFRIERQ